MMQHIKIPPISREYNGKIEEPRDEATTIIHIGKVFF